MKLFNKFFARRQTNRANFEFAKKTTAFLTCMAMVLCLMPKIELYVNAVNDVIVWDTLASVPCKSQNNVYYASHEIITITGATSENVIIEPDMNATPVVNTIEIIIDDADIIGYKGLVIRYFQNVILTFVGRNKIRNRNGEAPLQITDADKIKIQGSRSSDTQLGDTMENIKSDLSKLFNLKPQIKNNQDGLLVKNKLNDKVKVKIEGIKLNIISESNGIKIDNGDCDIEYSKINYKNGNHAINMEKGNLEIEQSEINATTKNAVIRNYNNTTTIKSTKINASCDTGVILHEPAFNVNMDHDCITARNGSNEKLESVTPLFLIYNSYNEVQFGYHEFDSGTVTTQPTTENEGTMTFKCVNCDDEKTEPIKKLQAKKIQGIAVVKGQEIQYELIYGENILPDDTLVLMEQMTNDQVKLVDERPMENACYLNITLIDKKTNAKIQPKGSVKLRIKIPDGWDKHETFMLHVEQGTDKEFDRNIDNDWIEIVTDEFSPYLLYDELTDKEKAAMDDKNNKSNNEKTNKNNKTTQNSSINTYKTGEGTTALFIALGFATISLCGALTLILKRKRND